MFGLLLDKEVCYNNIREIIAVADKNNSFIRIDMEDSSCTDDEILLYRRLKMEFPKRVGLVVQAYMRRTLNDLKQLMDSNSDASSLNFRLCKGIYVEDQSHCIQRISGGTGSLPGGSRIPAAEWYLCRNCDARPLPC